MNTRMRNGSGTMDRLTDADVQILDELAGGDRHTNQQIAGALGYSPLYVKQRLMRMGEIVGLNGFGINQRVLLAVWWNSPIFRIGLTELGLLPHDSESNLEVLHRPARAAGVSVGL
jgi:DNA-binding CsgD family transcriptional regulator